MINLYFLERRNGLLYQPPREDSILGSRSFKLYKRNGQPKTGNDVIITSLWLLRIDTDTINSNSKIWLVV